MLEGCRGGMEAERKMPVLFQVCSVISSPEKKKKRGLEKRINFWRCFGKKKNQGRDNTIRF